MRFAPTCTRIAQLAVVLPGFVFSLSAAAAGPVHRCVDEGRVTYSDRSCGAESEVVALAALAPAALGVETPHATSSAVTLGMSPRTVFDTIGRPYETVAMLEGRTLVEYWVYRSYEGRTRIAFQEGRVTRIHTR